MRTIDERGFVWLADLVSESDNRSEFHRLDKAARKLARDRRIEAWRYPWAPDGPLLGPPGSSPPAEVRAYGKAVRVGDERPVTRETLAEIIRAQGMEQLLDDYDLSA
jgi:hypothetical protein